MPQTGTCSELLWFVHFVVLVFQVTGNEMARLTQADLSELNQNLESKTPEELLDWAVETFGSRAGLMSAMQMSGTVLAHMLYRRGHKLDVLFVDTGVMFQETLDTRDRVAREYQLNVISLKPEMSMEEQTAQFGPLYLTLVGQEQCCEMRKTKPLLSVRGKYDALISALRRDEGERRSTVPIVSLDVPMNCLRVNPLANFTDPQLQEFILAHKTIVNPLHFQGYETIGCNRCTTPVIPGEPKRAGRWRHLGPWAIYCGINPTDVNRPNAPAIDWPQEMIDKVLGRKSDFVI